MTLSCVRPELTTIDPYRWQAGIPDRQVIRLDKNVLPLDPCWWPEVAASAAAEAAHSYPDSTYAALKAGLSAYTGFEASRIAVGAGSDELISACALATLTPGDVAITARPTYQMYGVATNLVGGSLVALDPVGDLRLDLDGVLAKASAARVVFVCSPNNPTGEQVPMERIAEIAETCPGLVVVDQAYLELGGTDVSPLLADHQNLVVLRTMSKGWGLAGIRVGYALGDPQVIAVLERLRGPASISAASAAAALAALDFEEVMRSDCAAYAAERARLRAGLESLGLTVIGDAGNFVAVRTPWSSAEAFERLAARGVVVRTLIHEPAMDGCIRPCLGTPAQNDLLLAALAAELGRPAPEPSGAVAPTFTRRGTCRRTTAETDIALVAGLDGTGRARVDTGIGFLDHLLASLSTHGLIDLDLDCRGDTHIDAHHTTEDVAIALGIALRRALARGNGISRFGDATVPLDEALATCAVDVSGRGYAVLDLVAAGENAGPLPLTLLTHMIDTLARNGNLAIHLTARGEDGHHVAEAAFKALGRALRAAVAPDPRRGTAIPSSKGVL